MSGEETRARFLTAIAAQLPVERVQEVHLFAPIRQGGMESGVAVIAVDFAPAPGAEANAGAQTDAGAEANARAEANADAEANAGAEANARAEANAHVDTSSDVDADADVDAGEDANLDAGSNVDAEADAAANAEADKALAQTTEPDSNTPETLQELLEEVPVEPATDDTNAPPARATRYTVYSARYRHTLKGPDRGKWEISVTDEADAPLLTVDAVVRGVSRRSGEADETVRLSGDEFRDAVQRPATA